MNHRPRDRRVSAAGNPEAARTVNMTRRHLILLAAWWVLLGTVNAVWLSRDTRPPSWDPCNHLVSSLKYRHAIESFDASRLLRVDDHYPPLAPFVAALLSLPFPAGPDVSTLLLSQLSLAVLLFAVFRLGEELVSPEAGVVAAIAGTSFFLFATQSRMFMLDLPDAAMTSLALLLLWRADDFGRWRPALAFGLALGAALLTKWTCLFFVWFPLCRGLGLALRGRWRRPGRLLASLALAAAVALPWYVAHLWNIARDFGKFGYSVGEREGDPPVASVKSLLYYAVALPRAMGLPWFLLFLAGLAGSAVALRKKALRGNSGLFLSMGIAGGWLVLTLLRNKDDRYLMPLLPALTILSAAGLLRLLPGRRAAFPVAAAALATLALAWSLEPPRREDWPAREAVAFLRGASPGLAAPRLRVIPDLPYFERHAFEYWAQASSFPLDVGTWFHFPLFTDFVVTKTGAQGDRPEPVRVMEEISRPSSDFSLLFRPKWRRPLPDGSVSTIYQREITPAAGVSADEFAAAFRSAALAEISRYARDPRALTLELEPYSDAETLRGHFRRVTIRAGSLVILPRPNAREGVEIEDARLVLDDLAANPHAVVRDEKIQILSLGELDPHFRLTEAAANRLLASVRGAPGVSFSEGLVRARLDPAHGPALDLSVRLSVVNGNIAFSVARCRVGGVPVPAFLVQWLASGNNPVLKPMPFRLRLDSLNVGRSELAVN